MDINGNEVITNGKPGNTDIALSDFKESPVEFMKEACPSDGYYVFIGGYNDDYHSFTIVVENTGDSFEFEFVDQREGFMSESQEGIENRFLLYIREWRENFPMYLSLYQLRNKKK